jgi:hypothetical protein
VLPEQCLGHSANRKVKMDSAPQNIYVRMYLVPYSLPPCQWHPQTNQNARSDMMALRTFGALLPALIIQIAVPFTARGGMCGPPVHAFPSFMFRRGVHVCTVWACTVVGVCVALPC